MRLPSDAAADLSNRKVRCDSGPDALNAAPWGACALTARVFRSYVDGMLALIIILLVVWAVLAFVGFAVKGLLWLAIIGLVFFVITVIVGFLRRSASK